MLGSFDRQQLASPDFAHYTFPTKWHMSLHVEASTSTPNLPVLDPIMQASVHTGQMCHFKVEMKPG
jgi:hypothetical protein